MSNDPKEPVCPKCRYPSGDDWKQCRGSCPMPGSPHYSENACRDSELVEAISTILTAINPGTLTVGDYANAIIAELRGRGWCSKPERDAIYADRDRLVQALSKVFPASLERHTGDGAWDEEWMNVVIVDLPTGQVSWHIHVSEVAWFNHLPRHQRTWDGHSTDKKHRRIDELSTRTL